MLKFQHFMHYSGRASNNVAAASLGESTGGRSKQETVISPQICWNTQLASIYRPLVVQVEAGYSRLHQWRCVVLGATPDKHSRLTGDPTSVHDHEYLVDAPPKSYSLTLCPYFLGSYSRAGQPLRSVTVSTDSLNLTSHSAWYYNDKVASVKYRWTLDSDDLYSWPKSWRMQYGSQRVAALYWSLRRSSNTNELCIYWQWNKRLILRTWYVDFETIQWYYVSALSPAEWTMTECQCC